MVEFTYWKFSGGGEMQLHSKRDPQGTFQRFFNTSQKTLFLMWVFGARYYFFNLFQRQQDRIISSEVLLSKFTTALNKDFPSNVCLRIY